MGNRISRRRHKVDERYTRPQGLYENNNVDFKRLRRLILKAKLAPCYEGTENQLPHLDECPICFLFYPSLNRSSCCLKHICTECFLQLEAPLCAGPTQCPFCKAPNYVVQYRGAKSMKEKRLEQAEEQKVIEAQIRIHQRELNKQTQMQPSTSQEGEYMSESSILQRSWVDRSDMDLEEMMVTEAIWLSIQEQHPQWDTSVSTSQGPCIVTDGEDMEMEVSFNEGLEDMPCALATAKRASFAGDMAGAFAAFLECKVSSFVKAGTNWVQQRNIPLT